MRRLVTTLAGSCFAALCSSGAALAAEDVVLSNLATWNGSPVDQAVAMDSYEVVVNQLGLAIANKPMAPGETLGVFGFDVGLSSTVAFIDTKDGSSGQPSPWARVHETGEPNGVMWIPWLSARKGLPLSLEVGGNLGYIAFSRQTVFSGYGRWGLWEGYHPIPDLSIQLGYSGYVGNNELELGAMDYSATLGYTLPFGSLVGINQAQFSPYLGVGQVIVHAAPRLDDDLIEDLGIGRISGFNGGEGFTENLRHVALSGGFRVLSGDVQLRMAVQFAPGQLTTVNGGLGFVY
jgi:hypothetical protein